MGVRDFKVQMGSVNIHIVLQLFAGAAVPQDIATCWQTAGLLPACDGLLRALRQRLHLAGTSLWGGRGTPI